MPVFIFVSADDIVKQLLEDEEDFDPEEVVAASTVRSTLGPEAQQIYDIASDDFKAAVERGSTARYDIDFHEHNAWPFYDDDSGWQQSFYSSYYVTSGGKIKIVLEEGDADGNWDWADSAVLDTPDYTALVKEFSYGSWQRRMRDYMEWVAQNGDDPLSEIAAPDRVPSTDKWLVGFVEQDGRPKFSIARHILAEPPSPPPVRSLEDLPGFVRDYAMLDHEGYVGMSWDEFVALDEVVNKGGYWQFKVTPESQPVPLVDKEAYYQRKAQEYLDRWTEPTDADEVPYWS